MDRLHRSMQVEFSVCIQLLQCCTSILENCAMWDIFIHTKPPSLPYAHCHNKMQNVMNNALKLPAITHQQFNSEYAKISFYW